MIEVRTVSPPRDRENDLVNSSGQTITNALNNGTVGTQGEHLKFVNPPNDSFRILLNFAYSSMEHRLD